jgi:hypothetical protein
MADFAYWRKTKLSGQPADFGGVGIFAMGAFTIEGIVGGDFVSGSGTQPRSTLFCNVEAFGEQEMT